MAYVATYISIRLHAELDIAQYYRLMLYPGAQKNHHVKVDYVRILQQTNEYIAKHSYQTAFHIAKEDVSLQRDCRAHTLEHRDHSKYRSSNPRASSGQRRVRDTAECGYGQHGVAQLIGILKMAGSLRLDESGTIMRGQTS